MPKRILVMGLPGAGKTYFAEKLKIALETNIDYPSIVDWINADAIRTQYNDWDFSIEGRIRQSLRMFAFAEKCSGDYVICDFIAPLQEMRYNFKADWIIWMDTIKVGRYEDTNQAFIPPKIYDFRITEKNAEKWAPLVASRILWSRHARKSGTQ